ncbi:membrane-bound alkaline phosphatase-like [Teleopsis dalmanni]|uniref:membrane-bound alkaline phosphatase-like n=1 Tax=Teleopsis dalmanni TaxID=139649 RepID=UPI0018CF1504|nr:membrane-bound alkaline phosphatase-like [Teleopsis dalmanni]
MLSRKIIWGFLVICLISVCSAKSVDHPHLKASSKAKKRFHSDELDSDYWFDNAQEYISNKLDAVSHFNTNRAKNIILFLGDGMSLHTVTAARSYIDDASHKLSFEEFPYFGLSKTFCIDKQVPDSASTSTAYLSAVKANYGTIGVNAQVTRRDCELGQDESYHTESIAKWAQDANKWTGLVTTARVTHASPAGVYAHTANREWENDAKIMEDECDPTDNVDIARQLVEWEVGRNLRVIMGGGRRNFINETELDESDIEGRRTDGRNLIEEWLTEKKERNVRGEYVWHKQDLLATDLSKVDYLLGLFSSSHCPYHGDLEREGLEDEVPSLSEMTEAAIEMLSHSKDGYFLFVEGAKIDMAHHDTRARRSMEETEEFAKAVEVALSMTNEKDTLIVVTSDHSHTMTISGYPDRDDDILGLNSENAADDLPYNILSYANGPGYEKTYSKNGRKDLSDKDFTNPTRKYMATAPLESETHGADDVGIFAKGPYAHYFSGNYVQTNIPMLMAKAADIGPFGSNYKKRNIKK